MQPTDEQFQALDLFAKGTDLAIEAGAGCGKTSTLFMIGNSTPRLGQYVAFNKSIVAEAKRKVPDSVGCSTAHGLAMKAIGYRYAHRLRSQRMLSSEVADKLNLRPLTITALGERKMLRPGYLAGLVMRTLTNFCNSDDPEPTIAHVPYIEGIDAMDNGKRGHYNNRQVARHIEHTLAKAWADICDPEGKLRFSHDHYLKLWQLSDPKINADYVLFDEAQDASPVMVDIIKQQGHAQKIWVGDSNQAIYEWRGAVNALASLEDAQRTFLSKSFRFGPAIADAANIVLTVLDAKLRLEGAAPHESNLGPLDAPTAYLYRTNAASLGKMLELLVQGKKPYLVGEGAEILAFARAVDQLQEKGFTTHPELACFSSWFEVLRYVNDDEQGSELKLMVDIVVRFGTPTIRRIFEQMVDEAAADVVISTAHKCSPPDEPVLTVDGWKAIGDLDPETDRVAGYVRRNNRLTWGGKTGPQGYRFEKAEHPFSGDLVVIKTEQSRTRVTPNHMVIAAFDEPFWDQWCVYLMRRGDWWRVGRCRSGSRPYRSGDLGSRMSAEGADSGWILSVHSSASSAAEEESRIHAVYGITGLTFERRHGLLSSETITRIHNEAIPRNAGRARSVLAAFGLLENHPLYQGAKGAQRQAQFLTAAANLTTLSGYVTVPCANESFLTKAIHRRGGWSPDKMPATITREHYEGPVYGLEIPPHHYYVSGGAVVHNSKGREWSTVRLGDDYPDVSESNADWRLLYVAATRAKVTLDYFDCDPLAFLLPIPEVQVT